MIDNASDHRKVEGQREDVLTKRWFHKILVLLHMPADWPIWKVFLAALLLSAVAGASWTVATGLVVAGLAAVLLLGLFILADALLLVALPLRRMSFGPWKSQLLVLAVPRTAAAVLSSLIAAVAGLAWGLASLVALESLASAALVWGALIEPFRLQLTHLTVETEKWLAGASPIELLHISDLHIERLTRREEKLLDLVEDTQPDIILITGDFLNLSFTRDKQAQDDLSQLLKQLTAPLGVYAVLGSPPVDERDVVPALLEKSPLRLLRDEWEAVDVGDGRSLVLIGLDCTHHVPADGQTLARVAADSPDTAPRVLLYHAPELMPQAAEQGIDLYLCGHTHGGQVRLPRIGALLTSSQLGKQYEMGHYRRGQTHLYVSRGVGLEGLSAPRVRFLAPPEITVVTIRSRGSRPQ
jgi:predicted MPP superfamily phosphohydrolase